MSNPSEFGCIWMIPGLPRCAWTTHKFWDLYIRKPPCKRTARCRSWTKQTTLVQRSIPNALRLACRRLEIMVVGKEIPNLSTQQKGTESILVNFESLLFVDLYYRFWFYFSSCWMLRSAAASACCTVHTMVPQPKSPHRSRIPRRALLVRASVDFQSST